MSQIFGDPKRLVNDYMAESHAIGIRKIGEYEPDILFSGQWAMGMDRKFPDLIAKYGTRHQLANPKSGPLDRSGNEGTRYRLQDRLANLVEEFQQRCM